jgi:hypothetical protein
VHVPLSEARRAPQKKAPTTGAEKGRAAWTRRRIEVRTSGSGGCIGRDVPPPGRPWDDRADRVTSYPMSATNRPMTEIGAPAASGGAHRRPRP